MEADVARRLRGVVRNGTALGSDTARAEVVEAGDSLVLLPAFSGGAL